MRVNHSVQNWFWCWETIKQIQCGLLKISPNNSMFLSINIVVFFILIPLNLHPILIFHFIFLVSLVFCLFFIRICNAHLHNVHFLSHYAPFSRSTTASRDISLSCPTAAIVYMKWITRYRAVRSPLSVSSDIRFV